VRKFGKPGGLPSKSPLVADDTSRIGVADQSVNREMRKTVGLPPTQPQERVVKQKAAGEMVGGVDKAQLVKKKAEAKKIAKKAKRSEGKAAKGKAVAEYEAKELTPMEDMPSLKYFKRGVSD
jgi:hypothetical protein